jgi:hypothetical protein
LYQIGSSTATCAQYLAYGQSGIAEGGVISTKRLGYIDAYMMYQLLENSDHWPTADDAPGGWRVLQMPLQASGSGYLAATI